MNGFIANASGFLLPGFFLFVIAMIAWKSKSKGTQDNENPAETLNNDMFAQFTGMPQSNGAMSPFSSSSPDEF